MSRKVDLKALVSHILRGDGSDRCRICMGDTTDGQVYLDDTVMIDGDKNVSLAELLETVTGIEIQDEAYCPSGVCVVCASTALAAQEFRIFVRNAKHMWSKAVASLTVLSTSSAPNVKNLYAFIRESDLSIQTVKDYAGGDPKVVLNRLRNRLSKKQTQKKPKSTKTGSTCCCPDCGKVCSSPSHLSMHLKNSGQKDACGYCGAVIMKGKDMLEHLSIVHGQKYVLCEQCPQLFQSEAKLKNHAKKAHKDGVLTCHDCGRTFARSTSFDLHASMHTVRICRTCGLQFTNRSCYREHRSHCEPDAKPDVQLLPKNRRSNIRDPAQYTCDHCGKTYVSRPQLKNHITWIHMDVRPHECKTCGKRFYTHGRLMEHSVVHTRVRNFECDICGAKLVSKMAAVYHRRRHTGEKPYKCKDCGDTFISASRRSDHAKRRHNARRLQCELCPYSFVRRYDLNRHIEKVHKNDN